MRDCSPERKNSTFCFSFNFHLQGLIFFLVQFQGLYAIVYKIQWQIYKQLHITLQVLKMFQFLYRYLPLKLNKEENETLQIKIE